jgi:hypothetical protein
VSTSYCCPANPVVGWRDEREIRVLKKAEERIGQYRNRTRAAEEARNRIRETGVAHRIQLTTTWRDLEPIACWTVVLGRPGRGDRFQG